MIAKMEWKIAWYNIQNDVGKGKNGEYKLHLIRTFSFLFFSLLFVPFPFKKGICNLNRVVASVEMLKIKSTRK